MHSRRFACFLVGLWLGAGLLMAWATTDSFHSVDRLLDKPSPAAAEMLKPLGDRARVLLRHQVSEQNRAAFQTWEIFQLSYGLGLFFFLLFGTREGKFSLGLALVMIALTALQQLFLTPAIVTFGRNIDFAKAGALPGQRSQFWLLHGAYSGLEVVKWGVGVGLMAKLVFSRRARSDNSRENLDSIDKRYDRHVNR